MDDTKRPGAPTGAASADGATAAGVPAPGAPPMPAAGPPPMPGPSAAEILPTLPPSAAGAPTTLPPPMPGAGPPPMPAGAAPIAPTLPPPAAGAPATLPPAMPTLAASLAAASGAAIPASLPPDLPTMQGTALPGGASAPVFATVTGAPLPVSRPPALPGARAFDAGSPLRYELGREIARGGMGRVVEATDTRLGRVVALKEVLQIDEDVLARFARETRITARLEHPSIVPLHDAGTMPGGAPYYVMRKISGRPLEQLVALAEALPQRLVLVPHLVAAAQAIAHAHERGVVHRDIKPSNILVGDLGETIVIDWGLAKVIGEPEDTPRAALSASMSASLTAVPPLDETDTVQTRAGIVFGTPGFMAPEQLRGGAVTEQCDVYALGATLYHVLARKPPHYSKSADEMMRAAVRGPPTPVRELVPGVPAELATIIDKALAHDPAQRYAHARALAEDLQRFLSGQLVASHHYSPREKLVRFIRKNRVPVIVAGVALATLAVVGAVAVTRVIGERDRADEERRVAIEERARAEERADRLTLTQARTEVDLNPTRAIAMVKPLAAKHAREVRSIAAAARANGVAYGLPAARTVETLELSADGTRAVAGGDDGSLRVYDLARRTAQELPRAVGAPASARFADQGRAVVAWNGTRIAVLDAATGKPLASYTAPTKIRDLEIARTAAVWIDEGDALWQLELAGGTPARVPLPERIREVSPSPDGRRLALLGREHLFILDRDAPAGSDEALTEILYGETRSFDWSTRGHEWAALVDESAIHGTVESYPPIMQRLHVGLRHAAVHANDRVYTLGPTGVAIVSRDESGPRKQVVGGAIAMREARGGAVIAGSQGGISVMSDSGDHTLAVPAGTLEHVEAHPRSPYVVGVIEGQLLVWNLDDIEPRRVVRRAPGLAQFAGPGHVIAGFADDGVFRIDLATGEAEELGRWELQSVAASPSGALACAIDAGHRARLLAPGAPPRELEGQYQVAAFASEELLLLGSADRGTIVQVDVRSGARTTLVASPGKLLDLAWNRAAPAYAAAAFGDGSLWRRRLDTGAAETARAAPTTNLQLARDGTLYLGEGRAIRAWRPGGVLATQAELPRAVRAIGLAGPDHLLAVLEDQAAFLVDLTRPDVAEETESAGRAKIVAVSGSDDVRVAMAIDAGLLVVANRGGIEVVDPIARHRWTLAVQPAPANMYERSTLAYTDPRISADGTRVIARLDRALYAWTIPQPASDGALAAWLAGLTNAEVDTRGARSAGKLVWATDRGAAAR